MEIGVRQSGMIESKIADMDNEREQEIGILAVKGLKAPDPEVPAKARRRKFSARYKKRILEEADGCKGVPGAIGALLRREGLYSSHLTTWRKQRERGELNGLTPKKRGRKAKPISPLARKVRELEAENRRLQKQLEKAETIIAFQKNSPRCWGFGRIGKKATRHVDVGHRGSCKGSWGSAGL